MLRAVGMSRKQVRRMVRAESVITAGIGAILGIVLGIVFALVVSRPLASQGFVFMIKRSRDYDDAQWDHYTGVLRRRGLLDAAGGLTQAGHQLKQRIEDATDALALPVLDVLDDGEVETLFRTLTPITRKVVAAGDVPDATPMGLGRDDLHDDSAHLS